jgi:Flp pilus assembly protein TadG
MRTFHQGLAEVRTRRGVVAVEMAVVLSTFLLILFGLLDLGLVVLNYNNLRDAAQQVTRVAIVRGKDAAPQFAVWGPATYSGTAASGDEIASIVASSLIIMPNSQVQVQVQWPDGACAEGNQVRATLSYTHPLIAPSILGITSIQLTGVSTARIID